jgi:hypothetical protein
VIIASVTSEITAWIAGNGVYAVVGSVVPCTSAITMA